MSLSATPLADAGLWVPALLGSTAVQIVCVLAIAGLGFGMLAGRISVRRSGLIILGCFLMLGAPAIAVALTGIGRGGGNEGHAAPTSPAPIHVPNPEARTSADPYSGASLISNPQNSSRH